MLIVHVPIYFQTDSVIYAVTEQVTPLQTYLTSSSPNDLGISWGLHQVVVSVSTNLVSSLQDTAPKLPRLWVRIPPEICMLVRGWQFCVILCNTHKLVTSATVELHCPSCVYTLNCFCCCNSPLWFCTRLCGPFPNCGPYGPLLLYISVLWSECVYLITHKRIKMFVKHLLT